MLIVAHKSGQLGNRLALFAHLIACAAEHDLVIANPSFDEYARYFESTSRDIWCRYPHKNSPIPRTRSTRYILYAMGFRLARVLAKTSIRTRLIQHIALKSDDDLFSLEDCANVDILKASAITIVSGWLFCGHNNLQKHADAIREYFTPIEPHRHNVATVIKCARNTCDILVGIHIRRGDYREFEGGKYFFDIDDYLMLMRRIERILDSPDVGFLVCSNETLDAKWFEGFNVHFGNNHLIEDMYAFAHCDYLVGPPSTYTIWASFYGRVPLYQIVAMDESIALDQFAIQ